MRTFFHGLFIIQGKTAIPERLFGIRKAVIEVEIMRLTKKVQFMRKCDRLKGVQKCLEKYEKENLKSDSTEQACYELLVELQECAIDLGSELEREGRKDIVAKLESYCEQVYECSLAMEKQKELLENCGKLRELYQEIEAEITTIPAKVKIAFFPYKISMWDSLESIWEASLRDENCESQIVPIPYYTKNHFGELEKMHYEGEKFAANLPILDYRSYFLEQEQPDIMYIHNPYDQYNKITMIEPRFFTKELKKSGGILVYVPYYILGHAIRYEDMSFECANMGVVYSDFIIMQCENQKKAYEFWGVPEKRLLSLGSPKIDAVLKSSKKTYDITEKWKSVLKDKKVILFNTSIRSSTQDGQWLGKMIERVKTVLRRENFALIWRPHPLLWDAIQENANEKKQYQNLIDMIQNAPNAIMDDSDNARAAMQVSDAMISDLSSLTAEYTFTGKPAYILMGKSAYRQYQVFCDYFSNYFQEDGCQLEDFLEMVANGTDEKRDERLSYAKKSMKNTDGTCGREIHREIARKYLERLYEDEF